ncbi:uncharacterized protein IL334_007215 [Kwoniella shivajii]|uniref:Uncharacterized protein n=1 Tax=Kwoniella shivajii TaxID=564305 RepID=A0ABZ1DA69_9TREE|nr:hypothetical protein IL334_007215 [Kwoniella shivajii]
MVPDRLDTLPQRKRKESLDTLRNHPISHTSHPPSKPHPEPSNVLHITPSGHIKTPKPVKRASLPIESREDRHERMRKISSREILYPTPEAAKEAFRVERYNNPPVRNRRPPTPHTSSRKASSIKRADSDRSIRSRVSFDSTRSRRSNRSGRSGRTGSDSDGTVEDGWEPSFASTNGIGPAGEAIEVIGLGRKKPRHRTFNSGMLKPALRSTSRVNSRATLRDQVHNGERVEEKPLPNRPMSSIVNSITKLTGGQPTRKMRKRSSHQPLPASSFPDENNLLGASSSVLPRIASRSQANQNRNGFRSLFSSLSLDPKSPALDSNLVSRSLTTAPSRSSRRHVISPAEDLSTYLRYAEVTSWDRWPVPSASHKKGLSLWGGKRTLGFEEMSWEWHRRLQLAEESRNMGRMLGSWEIARNWETDIINWHEENVPFHPVDVANRWGSQIFALPAEGFDTLEFFDESISQAEDFGLLSWITGTLLQTAVSTSHMLRYSSHSFTFHLIPSPRPPHLQNSASFPLHDSSSTLRAKPHFLWEGFGTMVLVNKSNDIDRTMVLEIRPPSVLDSGVIKEFARGKNGESWWGFYGDTCIGDIGQANLLQAQVYDDCIQNQVYFFAVTNLKYWVFGQFNSNYTQCTVSPVIHRQGRDPSLMQCLTAWVVRSVDERPRATDPHPGITPPPHEEREREREHRRHRRSSQPRPSGVPSYSDNVRSRSSTSRATTLPPRPHGYDHPSSYSQPGPHTGISPTPVYPMNTSNVNQSVFQGNSMILPQNGYSDYGLPPYSDIPPSSMSISPIPYHQSNMVTYAQPQIQAQWNNGTSRAFSPNPTHTPTPHNQMQYNYGNDWYGGGMFPWGGIR